jgi:flavin-dependent dehydrogenase
MPSGRKPRLQLHDGARIAVIGGGPSGSFLALHALDLASRQGRRIQVAIFEGKDFSRRGPRGCNKCAGILSSHLLHNLRTLQLTVPPEVVRAEVGTYVLHLGNETVEITQPDPRRRIMSVYRGAGPRLGDLPSNVSFDAWLLGEAQRRGATLFRERVARVTMEGQPAVITRSSSVPCDLLVLATGVNSRPVQLSDLSYEPPATLAMSQDETAVSLGGGNQHIHVYCDHPSGSLFSCLVPKGSYVNISLLGRELTKDSVGRFLDARQVREVLGKRPQRLCGCAPHIAVSMARSYFADRFVAVGDAAVTRLYKDGIGSAFLTARQAARVALNVGVSEAAFREGYAPFCEGIKRDNRIGKALFALWDRMQRSCRMRQAWLAALKAEEGLPPAQQHCRVALWHVFTGDDSYRAIMRRLLGPRATFRILAGLLRTI